MLDLEGGNRYVMTRTKNLAPLVDLERAQVTSTIDGTQLQLANTGDVAAIGIIVEGAVSDNVLDLLPGESRTIEVEGETRVEGWNV